MTSSRDQELRAAAEPAARRPGERGPVRSDVGAQRFVKVGLPLFSDLDIYRFAVSLNTRRFILFFLSAELAINTLFAGLYLLVPGSIANLSPPGVLGAFFFSLETLATVGYGEMFPGSLYGHVVAAVEILVGVGFTALMTGLLFVRFSKPKPRIVYATRAVVTRMNGVPTLVLRIGNIRAQPLHDATARLHMLTRSVTAEGVRHAFPVELTLLRERMPIFAITWNLMHRIDETSPLFGLSPDADIETIRFFLSLEARDPTIGQSVSDLHTFVGADVAFGMRYVDAVTAVNETTTLADFSLLSEIEPDPVVSEEGRTPAA